MRAITVRSRWFTLAATALSLVLNAFSPSAIAQIAVPQAEDVQAGEPAAKLDQGTPPVQAGRWRTVNREAVVMFGRDVLLKSNEVADAVVVIGGSARIEGKVREAVVAIGGNVTIHGEVGQAVVAIGGDVTVGGKVGEAVVAVMGDVKLEPTAKVRRDVVAVGGKMEMAEGASVGGAIQEVSIGGLPLPKLGWLTEWLKECVFKFRPLAPQVGWIWWVNGAFLLVYLLIALAFPGAVQACVNQLNQRPASTFLTGLLMKMLIPFGVGLLAITGIGLLGVPFLLAAALLAKLFGKVALFIYLGLQLTRPFKTEALQHRLATFMAGWILITLLYMVPFLGLFTQIVLNTWALGVAVMAVMARSRHEAPPRTASLAPAPSSTPTFAPLVPTTYTVPFTPPAPDPVASAGLAPDAFAAPPILASPQRVPPTISPVGPVAAPDALIDQRASFWLRVGAGFLDLVLVGIACLVFDELLAQATRFTSGFFGRGFPIRAWLHQGPWFPIFTVAYFTVMWAWKGTTVGGIVTSLRVAREDGRPLTVPVALVRALSAWFSGVVLFLGFFWIAWNRERQGWHDKIAGTVVVRSPKNMPLI